MQLQRLTGIGRPLGFAVAVLLTASAAHAGFTGAWHQITPPSSTTPPGNRNVMLAYDSDLKKVVTFSGGENLTDLWAWDGSSWSQLTSTGAIWVGSGGGFAYDRQRKLLVEFGGFSGQGGAFSNYSNQTQLWDATTGVWSQLTGTLPPVRAGAAMTYDEDAGVIVMFGGGSAGADDTNTWMLSASGWEGLCTTGPCASTHPRGEGIMTYAPGLGDVYVENTGYNGTWALTNVNVAGSGPIWTQIGTVPTTLYEIFYDTADSQLVGLDWQLHTWVFSGGTWMDLNIPGPTMRSTFAATYDENLGQAVLYGSYQVGNNDTWTTGCAADSDCTGSACASGSCYCSAAHGCVAIKSPGSPCDVATDCAVPGSCAECGSIACTGGVCCPTACSGACMSCATGACMPATDGTSCGAGSCGGSILSAPLCASGMCGAPTMHDCSPFACAAGACKSSCMTDTDCAAPNTCTSGACSLPMSLAETTFNEVAAVGVWYPPGLQYPFYTLTFGGPGATYTKAAGPDGLLVDASGLLSWKPTAAGMQTISVVATASDGTMTTKSWTVKVLALPYGPPTGAVSVTPMSGPAALSTTASVTTTAATPSASILGAWLDKGDGSPPDPVTLSAGTAALSYGAPGGYTLTLHVLQNDGEVTESKTLVSVTDPSGALPPTGATANVKAQSSGSATFAFDCGNPTCHDGSTPTVIWTTADGGTETGCQTTHTFSPTNPNLAVQVRLEIVCADGTSTSDSGTATMGTSPPSLAAYATPAIGKAPLSTVLTAEPFGLTSSIGSVTWSAAGSSIGTGLELMRSYPTPESETVTAHLVSATGEAYAFVDLLATAEDGTIAPLFLSRWSTSRAPVNRPINYRPAIRGSRTSLSFTAAATSPGIHVTTDKNSGATTVTPTKAGAQTFTLTATNSAGSATQNATVTGVGGSSGCSFSD